MIAALFVACCAGGVRAEDLPSPELLTNLQPKSEVQIEKEQLALKEYRSADARYRSQIAANISLWIFVFGVFCAIWAQNTRRNAWLWFLIGCVFNVFALLAVLRCNTIIRARPHRRGFDHESATFL